MAKDKQRNIKVETVDLICRALLSGILIGIGDMVNMLCPNKIVGALLFSLGLLAILHNQLYLYTGRIGMIWYTKDFVADIVKLVGGLVCNILGVLITVFLYSQVNPDFSGAIQTAMGRLNNIFPSECFVGGIFCGVMMTVAVISAKGKNKIVEAIITIFCVMVFILAGFKHCIANAPMLLYNGRNIINYFMMILGNSVGSIVFCGLYYFAEKCQEK